MCSRAKARFSAICDVVSRFYFITYIFFIVHLNNCPAIRILSAVPDCVNYYLVFSSFVIENVGINY